MKREKLPLFAQLVLAIWCVSAVVDFVNYGLYPTWMQHYPPWAMIPEYQWASTVSLLLLVWFVIELLVKKNRSWKNSIMLVFSFCLYWMTQESTSTLLSILHE